VSPLPTLADVETEVRARALRRATAADPARLELVARAAAAARRPFTASLAAAGFSVIAEIKRASPSAGALRPELDPATLAREYADGGARALSVLTCEAWFRGSHDDLAAARAAVDLPVLCKDFLVTPFQVAEAAAGADAVLLIAALLGESELAELAECARDFRLEILFEVHDERELERVLAAGATLVGVNSRDLRTLQVAPAAALRLGARLPPSVHGVFESGVKSADDLRAARDAGFRSALVGEALLRAPDPGGAVRRLLEQAGGP
jgi:indole-3-glycerol phosphate synthase